MKFQSLDQVTGREAFDAQATLTKENYVSTIAETSFPDSAKGKCQLLRVHKTCPAEFQRGWLVQIQGGTEVLLGGCCAGHHFKLAQFTSDSAQLRRAIELDDLTTRLAAHRNDAELLGRLEALHERFLAYERAITAVRRALPGRVALQLMRMAPSGRGSAEYRVRYIDEDRNGNDVERWESAVLGPIEGLGAVGVAGAAAIAKQLHEARRALQSEATGLSIIKLRQQTRSIAGLDALPGQIESLEKSFAAFSTVRNLSVCSLLAPHGDDRLKVVKLGLRLAGDSSGDADAQRQLERLRDELSALESGRAVRLG